MFVCFSSLSSCFCHFLSLRSTMCTMIALTSLQCLLVVCIFEPTLPVASSEQTKKKAFSVRRYASEVARNQKAKMLSLGARKCQTHKG